MRPPAHPHRPPSRQHASCRAPPADARYNRRIVETSAVPVEAPAAPAPGRAPASAHQARAARAPPRVPFDHPLQHAEHAQQRADHDPRPPRTQRAVERDQHLDRAEDADAEHRADHIAHAAGEQRAADHGRGDRVEFHPLGLQPVTRQHVQREHDAAERRTEAAQRVHADLRARDRQPHQQRRTLVAADRVDVAAEAREMRDVDRAGQRRERDQRARAQRAAAHRHAEARDRMKHRLVDRDRLRGDQEARAARNIPASVTMNGCSRK